MNYRITFIEKNVNCEANEQKPKQILMQGHERHDFNPRTQNPKPCSLHSTTEPGTPNEPKANKQILVPESFLTMKTKVHT